MIGALAEMLDMGDQFHRLFTEAYAELFWSIGMVVCHFCWDEWVEFGRGFRQHQQEQESASDGTSVGFSGKGLEGRISLDFLPLNTQIIASNQ